MPIFNGADLTHEDIETVNSAVLNVVGGLPVPTVGAGCYPVPMYPSVPSVFSAPLPTFWMARPRNVTAAPLHSYPVTSIAAPPGMAGISISNANMPFVWGVSGYPARTTGGSAVGFRQLSQDPSFVAGQVVLDLATGNWDGAFAKAGVGQAPVQLSSHQAQPPSPPSQGERMVVLLAAPTPTPNICGRVAKRLAYILSNLDPAFSGANHAATVGNPVIPISVQLQDSDLVSLRDAAIATGLELAGFRDPAVVQAALMSSTIANIANSAMAQQYEQLVRQDLAQEGVTVGAQRCQMHPNGALTVSGGPEVVGNLGSIFGNIAAAVSSAAGPISSLVNAVSSGKFDLNQLANAVSATLPAISTAAAAMGAKDLAKAAKGLSASFQRGAGSVRNALSLVNSLARRAGTNPANLGVAVMETARQIAVQRRAPRSLLEELSAEELGVQAAIVADAERRPRRPRRRRRRKAAYPRRRVQALIDDISYVSSSPEDLVEILEEALGSKAARRDPVKALQTVLEDRLDYFQQEQMQQQQFAEESDMLEALQRKLTRVRSRKAAKRLMKNFLKLAEDYADQYQQ